MASSCWSDQSFLVFAKQPYFNMASMFSHPKKTGIEAANETNAARFDNCGNTAVIPVGICDSAHARQ
jgi:hypothetical protein